MGPHVRLHPWSQTRGRLVRDAGKAIQNTCTQPEVGQGSAIHPIKGHGSQGWFLIPTASQHLAMLWEEPRGPG